MNVAGGGQLQPLGPTKYVVDFAVIVSLVVPVSVQLQRVQSSVLRVMVRIHVQFSVVSYQQSIAQWGASGSGTPTCLQAATTQPVQVGPADVQVQGRQMSEQPA